jgi:hypothetical protein
MSYLRICFCFHIVVSNTYCVVSWFSLSFSCVPNIVSVSGFSTLISPSVFSNVYLLIIYKTIHRKLKIVDTKGVIRIRK